MSQLHTCLNGVLKQKGEFWKESVDFDCKNEVNNLSALGGQSDLVISRSLSTWRPHVAVGGTASNMEGS